MSPRPSRRRGATGRLGLLLFLLLLPGLAGCWVDRRPGGGAAGGTATEGPRESNLWTQVTTALDSSAAAWNRGDLSGFMAPYLRSGAITYIGGPGLVVGHRSLRQRYAPLFRPGAERDSLRFADLSTRPLGEDHALATGRYVLHRRDSVTSHGYFSLVLRDVEGSWRIVHDHSSEAEGSPPGDGPPGGEGSSRGGSSFESEAESGPPGSESGAESGGGPT